MRCGAERSTSRCPPGAGVNSVASSATLNRSLNLEAVAATSPVPESWSSTMMSLQPGDSRPARQELLRSVVKVASTRRRSASPLATSWPVTRGRVGLLADLVQCGLERGVDWKPWRASRTCRARSVKTRSSASEKALGDRRFGHDDEAQQLARG